MAERDRERYVEGLADYVAHAPGAGAAVG